MQRAQHTANSGEQRAFLGLVQNVFTCVPLRSMGVGTLRGAFSWGYYFLRAR